MTVNEMMLELNRLFPGSFAGPDGFGAWSRVYHDALDSYNGVPLRQGFKEVMAGWDKGWAPKPAEIAPACERARAVQNRPKEGAGVVNMRRVSEEARRLKPVLVDAWFRFNGPAVESFLERFEGQGGAGDMIEAGSWEGRIRELSDRQLALQKLAGLVRARAQDVAMAQASEGHFVPQPHIVDDKVRRHRRQVEIDAEDFDRIAAQVASPRGNNFSGRIVRALRDVTLRDGPDDFLPAPESAHDDGDVEVDHG